MTPSSGDHVWGVLWELEESHLATLDHQEGVHSEIYRRVELEVVHEGRPAKVLSYRLRDERMLPPEEVERCRPSKVYKAVIVSGAKENGLPEEYVDRWA